MRWWILLNTIFSALNHKFPTYSFIYLSAIRFIISINFCNNKLFQRNINLTRILTRDKNLNLTSRLMKTFLKLEMPNNNDWMAGFSDSASIYNMNVQSYSQYLACRIWEMHKWVGPIICRHYYSLGKVKMAYTVKYNICIT